MYKIYVEKANCKLPLVTAMCDSAADLADLPTSVAASSDCTVGAVGIGSAAYIISGAEKGNIYILGSDGWEVQ